MWFKNLQIYRFTDTIDLADDTLEESLGAAAFRPCGNMDFSSHGWVPPLGKNSELLTHSSGGFRMICARKQEKILPAAAINEQVEEKILELEMTQARNVYRKEKQQFKEEVTHTLLPRALTRSALTFAYFDTQQQLLVIDAASSNKAEELLELLRATLGSLPVVPLNCHGDIANIMTRWLRERIADGFEFDGDCELQNPRDSKNIVRCRHQELESSEVLNHLQAGKRAIQLAVVWRKAIHCVIADDFAIKRLRFADIVQEQAESDADDRASQFDQDFAIMTLQLQRFIEELVQQFGGIEQE